MLKHENAVVVATAVPNALCITIQGRILQSDEIDDSGSKGARGGGGGGCPG